MIILAIFVTCSLVGKSWEKSVSMRRRIEFWLGAMDAKQTEGLSGT